MVVYDVPLLAENHRIGPSHFWYSTKTKKLVVSLPLDNRDITARRFRSELEDFLADIIKTENVWNPAKWVSADK